MKKFFFALSFLCFLIPAVASATSYEQLDHSSSYGPSYGYRYQNWNSARNVTGDWWFYLSSVSPNTYELYRNGDYGCSEYSNSVEVSEPGWYRFTFSGSCYNTNYVRVKPYQNETSEFTIYGSTNPDSFTDGYAGEAGSLADLAFAFNSEGMPDPPGTLTPEVILNSPTDTSTLPDFQTFGGTATALEGPMLSYTIKVGYGRDTGTNLADYDFSDDDLWFGGEGTAWTVSKLRGLDTGLWYARAYIYDQEGTLLDNSDEISFTITLADLGSGASDYDPPPEVDCGPTDFICQIGNWFSNIIPSIGRYLFVPSQTVLNKYQDIWPSVEQKVPIGYFPLISNAIEDITEGEGAYSLPEIDFFSTIRTAVGVLIWVLFGFWLIKRISIMQV